MHEVAMEKKNPQSNLQTHISIFLWPKGIQFGLHSPMATECKAIAGTHFQIYLCLGPI